MKLAHPYDTKLTHVKPVKNPVFTCIEETDYAWIAERWATAIRIEESSYWSNLASQMYCCAMALWEMAPIQRREYLVLSALADTHSLLLNIKKG